MLAGIFRILYLSCMQHISAYAKFASVSENSFFLRIVLVPCIFIAVVTIKITVLLNVTPCTMLRKPNISDERAASNFLYPDSVDQLVGNAVTRLSSCMASGT